MARTNLHELATRLLRALDDAAEDGVFEGKLRTIATDTGLNSVRSAEAIKLLEELGRLEVKQRGRRGRDTIVEIRSTEPVSLEDAERMLPSRASKRSTRLDYEDLGRAVVDRLLELARDDSLRAAQVEAFAAEMQQHRSKVSELELALEEARLRERELRIKLSASEEALARAEENLKKAFGSRSTASSNDRQVDDEDARAVLDILRSARP